MTSDSPATLKFPRLHAARVRLDSVYMRWARSRVWAVCRRSWLIQFAALAVAFQMLHDLFYKMIRLKEPIYMDGFVLEGIATKPRQAITIVILFLVLLVFHRRASWRRMGSRWVRPALLALLAVTTWGLAFNGFNYFTNQPYVLDRVLIAALFLLSIRWPAFIPLLLGYLLMFFGQGRISVGALELTDKFPLIDVQIAFIGFMMLRTILPMRARSLIWFLVALQAVDYLAPGIAKISIGGDFQPFTWALEDPLHCLGATGHAHGWFYWFDQETVESLIRFTAHFTPVMAAFTLIVELGAVVLAPLRRVTIAWLIGGILLHLGIFVLTGILFWKWMVLDAVLITGLMSMPARLSLSRTRAFWMLVLIACYPLYAMPKYLGWCDTNLSEWYAIEVVAEDGTVYRVDQADMEPYDITFEQGDSHYANTEPTMTFWGNILDYEMAHRINSVNDPDEMRRLIESHGTVRFDQKQSDDFTRFLRTYFNNVNARQGSMRWMKYFSPPNHLHVRSGGERYDFKTPIRRVQVRFVRTLFDGEHIITLDDRVIRDIELD